MNIRIIATVALSIAFLALFSTGVLLYSTPYDYFTSALHIWASIILFVSLTFHFYNNWKVYLNHLSKGVGKFTLLCAIIAMIPLSYSLISEKGPAKYLIEFGEKLRSSGKVRDGEFEIIDLRKSRVSRNLEIFVKAGNHYTSPRQPLFLGFTYSSIPQVALWIETLDGEFVDTLYVTNKISNSGFQSSSLNQSEAIRRPEALPFWSHRRGVKSADGLYVPDIDSVEFDGLTSPTPLGDHYLLLPGNDRSKYKLRLEINRSYDFNDFYSRDRFPDDPIYSGSGSSGQPSLVYETQIDFGRPSESLMELIGHAHHSGQNGKLYNDLSRITTAKEILSFVVVKVYANRP